MGSNHRHAASEAAVLPAELPGIANDGYTTRPVHFLQPPPSPRISAAVGLGLTVAVRAKHPEVLEPMVVLDTIDVIDVSHERLPAPFGETAFLAAIFKQAGT